jgi:hypothetical protein
MAELVHEARADRIGGGTFISPRPWISWGAIFGGAVTALGIWLLLYAFGLAVGLTVLDARDPSSLKPSGIFTGIWAVVTPLIALFVGGMVAGRGAGVPGRREGAAHGLVMWGLTTLVGAYIVVVALAAAMSGVASVGQAGGSAVGAAASGAASGGGAAEWFGLNADDALRPINRRLAAEGKPTVTAEQLTAATRDVVQRGVREGRIDRSLLIQSIAQNTSLSRSDAEELTDRIEAQWQRARGELGDRLQGAAQSAQAGALRAAKESGKAFWGLFGALLLGLIAAVAGGATGAPGGGGGGGRRERVPEPIRSVPPAAPPREVYP